MHFFLVRGLCERVKYQWLKKDGHDMKALSLFKRDVLVSIKPVYVEKILDGQKTVELRRKFPDTSVGATILIYSTSPVQAVVGYARIKAVLKMPVDEIWSDFGDSACIRKTDFDDYFDGLDAGYAIQLEGVTALERQMPASELRDAFGFVPPQSFRYLDGDYNSLLRDERLQTPYRHERRHSA